MQHISHSELIYATAKAGWMLRSENANELANDIFKNSSVLDHLIEKIQKCQKTGGLFRLIQSLDYENTQLLEKWIKSLILR